MCVLIVLTSEMETPPFSRSMSHDGATAAAINPFLELNSCTFRYLQISVQAKSEAKSHPEYERRFKSLGIKPTDKLIEPDIVYMVVGKE